MQAPIIAVIAGMIRENPETISLGQGVVHYGPPNEAVKAMKEYWSNGENHKYLHVEGIPALLEVIRSKLSADNGIKSTKESRVVVTAGSNMGFVNAILAIADPGDEIILLSPYYFNHEMAVGLASAKPVVVPAGLDYQPRLDLLSWAVSPRTRAIVTISPNNPTGAVYSQETLRGVNDLCRERGIYHISDEAYEYFTYDGARHFSPGSIEGAAHHTISLFSLSKSYGFASWRVGYMVIPEHLGEAVRKIQDTILICPPGIGQYAALGALKRGPKYVHKQVAGIERVRKLVLDSLRKLGDRVTVPETRGAFYFLVRVHTDLEDMALVRRLIEQHRVAVIPGATFGLREGCYLRVSYGAMTRQTVVEGIGRLVDGLQALEQHG
ncbi:MAG: aspartate/tyrosine/aromatic aminotransferase [Acidobacteria bacterium]|nr:aspartate/tyrosine/aromatic aminotransferase [Acidobacteriota bacterium]